LALPLLYEVLFSLENGFVYLPLSAPSRVCARARPPCLDMVDVLGIEFSLKFHLTFLFFGATMVLQGLIGLLPCDKTE
jgi:hypothetical protein